MPSTARRDAECRLNRQLAITAIRFNPDSTSICDDRPIVAISGEAKSHQKRPLSWSFVVGAAHPGCSLTGRARISSRPHREGVSIGERSPSHLSFDAPFRDNAWWHHASSAQTRRDRDSGHDVDGGRLYEFDDAHGNNDSRKDGCARVGNRGRNSGNIIDQRQPFDIPRDGLCRTARRRDPGQRRSGEGTR